MHLRGEINALAKRVERRIPDRVLRSSLLLVCEPVLLRAASGTVTDSRVDGGDEIVHLSFKVPDDLGLVLFEERHVLRADDRVCGAGPKVAAVEVQSYEHLARDYVPLVRRYHRQ